MLSQNDLVQLPIVFWEQAKHLRGLDKNVRFSAVLEKAHLQSSKVVEALI
jgi:hypothetical protein